jgi:hypothetical protein
MTGWKAKRFWKAVTVVQEGGGFAVRLDARPVKTPAKRPLVLPTRAMAEAVAAEWAAVDNAIDPRRMPVTRAANAAIDKVATQFDEVAAMIAAYGASDLLCYRATAADPLARAQAEAWDPMLAWAERTYGARLATTEGVVPIAQPAEARSCSVLPRRATDLTLTTSGACRDSMRTGRPPCGARTRRRPRPRSASAGIFSSLSHSGGSRACPRHKIARDLTIRARSNRK